MNKHTSRSTQDLTSIAGTRKSLGPRPIAKGEPGGNAVSKEEHVPDDEGEVSNSDTVASRRNKRDTTTASDKTKTLEKKVEQLSKDVEDLKRKVTMEQGFRMEIRRRFLESLRPSKKVD